MTPLPAATVQDCFATIKSLLSYDEDAYALCDVLERRLLHAEKSLLVIERLLLEIEGSAPCADAADAGAEVIPLHHYSRSVS